MKPHTINLRGLTVRVNFEMLLTMIDGKVHAVITDTSSPAVCSVCNATPKQFNNLREMRSRPTCEAALMLGLSKMHSWIRFYEFILNVAYKLEVRKWSHRNEEEKAIYETTKAKVNALMWEKMGLIVVGRPRARGAGTSNDGNSARRAFGDEKTFAEATGVSETLIRRLHIILQVMACGHQIDK